MARQFVIAAAAAGFSAVAGAYEEPKFTVERQYEEFEVRRYAPYVAVETDASGDFEAARKDAFRGLFAYISGNNTAEAEVAMTVPVTTTPGGDMSTRIEMTAPVTTRSQGATQVMQFVLPSKFSFETAPRPRDPRVRLRQVGEQLLAARRYAGRTTEENYRDQEAKLLTQLRAVGLSALSPPAFAVYNGPFTPWFLRRNEVLVRIERPDGATRAARAGSPLVDGRR